jgi:four helix bundle protein
MELEELRVYEKSMDLGKKVWNIVKAWDHFEKDTIGKQLVRSVDSVAANLCEGFGRFHFKDSKNFYYYSRGSLYETKTWLTKARNRNLITEEEYNSFIVEINNLGETLNSYIKSIGNRQYTGMQEFSEPEVEYGFLDTNDKFTNDSIQGK